MALIRRRGTSVAYPRSTPSRPPSLRDRTPVVVGELGKIIKTFGSYLDSFEDDFIVEEVDPGRYYFLRPSSFPYCGLKKLLNANKDIDAPRLNTFSSEYFTKVGHTTHDVFQTFAGRKGKLVGDWECKTCGTWVKFSCDHICKCGEAMKYHELEIIYKGIVVGHMDGLFRLEPSKGKKSQHVMIDYKTSSTKNINLTPKASPFPYKSNVHQIESYVPIAELQYGIKVDFWLLIYLARDAPFKYGRAIRGAHLNEEDKQVIVKRLDRWVRTHKLVLTATTKADFERVAKRKLCKSLQDYTDNYASPYEACPHMGTCFSEERLGKALKKALTYKIYPILDNAPKKIRKRIEEVL